VIPVDGNNSAKRAAVGDSRTPKTAEVLVDLTSDSEDELPLKRKIPQPKSTPPALDNIKTDDNYTTSSAEAVTSSGYRSPGGGAVISLDSPSPPAPASPHTHSHVTHTTHTTLDAVSPRSLSSDICTSNNIEREENDSAPTHWAPYADAERETHDTYRRGHVAFLALSKFRGRPPTRCGADVRYAELVFPP
ncbi:sumo ligase, partial [Danaus plexippus plexippus]